MYKWKLYVLHDGVLDLFGGGMSNVLGEDAKAAALHALAFDVEHFKQAALAAIAGGARLQDDLPVLKGVSVGNVIGIKRAEQTSYDIKLFIVTRMGKHPRVERVG